MSVLGIDMDGVIADFISRAMENANKIFDLDLKYEDIKEPRFIDTIFHNFSKEHKKKFKKQNELYRIICEPGFFLHLKPIGNAIETVKNLSLKHDIIFITKPLEWEYCPGEKQQWLRKYFSDINYDIVMTNSMQAKKFIDVDFMFDDDPRTISSIEYGTPVLIKRPWNEDFLKTYTGNSIDSIEEAELLIESINGN